MFYVVEITIAVPALSIQFSVGKTVANQTVTFFTYIFKAAPQNLNAIFCHTLPAMSLSRV